MALQLSNGKRNKYKKYNRDGRILNVIYKVSEKRYIDTVINQTNITISGVFTLLNGSSFGALPGEHTGQTITATSVDLSLSVRADSNQDHTYIRVLIVADSQCNGAIFSMLDLFQDVNNGGSYVDSRRNYGNLNRFIVVHDQKLSMDLFGSGIAKSVRTSKRLNFKTQYNTDGNGLIGDIDKYSLYLVLCQDTTSTPDFGGTLRFNFIDG